VVSGGPAVGQLFWAGLMNSSSFYLFNRILNEIELILSKDGLLNLKKSNNICMCRELNKKQLSLLEYFKIWDKF
jgi:hypothetical protein